MIAFLVVILACAGLLSAPAWLVARRRNTWLTVDCVSLVGPLPAWFLLAALGVGPQSPSNLIELVIVGALIPVAISLRVFLLERLLPRPFHASLATLAFLMAAPVVLRLSMPLLPE